MSWLLDSSPEGPRCPDWYLTDRPAEPCTHMTCWELAACNDRGPMGWWYWHPDEDETLAKIRRDTGDDPNDAVKRLIMTQTQTLHIEVASGPVWLSREPANTSTTTHFNGTWELKIERWRIFGRIGWQRMTETFLCDRPEAQHESN